MNTAAMELLRNITICIEYISHCVYVQPKKALATIFFAEPRYARATVRSGSLSVREKLISVYIVAFFLLAAEFFVFPLLRVQASPQLDQHTVTAQVAVSPVSASGEWLVYTK